MVTFRYSRQAEQELSAILAYTKERWGEPQSQRYLDQLAAVFTLLATHKQMGRTFSRNHPSWRRFEHASHIIVYSPIAGGIRVQRLVHKNQLLERAAR